MRFFCVFASALLASSAAYAAGANDYNTSPASAWAGPYVGANIGYAWGDVDFSSVVGTGSMSPDTVIGGVQAGYNWQFGNNIIVGAEIGASLLDGNDSTTDALGIESKSDSKWGASARLRVGYAVDDWMVYASGGGAMTDAKGTSIVAPGFADTDRKKLTGWVLGAGMEKMMSQNISMRLDYSHYDYGTETFNYNYGPPVGTGSAKVKTKADVVTVGVNYKF
mgnify:CR=1 FL=1